MLDLLQKTSKVGVRPAEIPVETPVEPNHGLDCDSITPLNLRLYQLLVGTLIKLMIMWLDNLHAVSVVSPFMHVL